MTAGDVDYAVHGRGYAAQRRTDPRIARFIDDALGDARTVLNVGAGAGSYEPQDRHVVAVEPSAAMRAQRPAHAVPAIDARAEYLPFDDDAFDAAMATVTVHQWRDLERGLHELRRVTRGPVVVLTFDGDALDRFWLKHYVPELLAAERARSPAIARIVDALGGRADVVTVPIPIDCVDGFSDAFYARPEAFLDEAGGERSRLDLPRTRHRAALRRTARRGSAQRRMGSRPRRVAIDAELRRCAAADRRTAMSFDVDVTKR